MSRKYYDPNPSPSTAKKIWGWVIIGFCLLSLIGQIMRISKGIFDKVTIETLSFSIGLIGLGVYLLQLARGKNFNTEALSKVD